MKIQALIDHLQSFSQDAKDKLEIQPLYYSIPLWEETWKLKKTPVEPATLSLEDAGKAVRIIRAIFKKDPDSEWISDTKNVKRVVWNCGTELRKKLANRAAAELYLAGIYDYSISVKKHGLFFINIPENCYVSVFMKSDDPEVWKAENERKGNIKKVNQVVRKMDSRY